MVRKLIFSALGLALFGGLIAQPAVETTAAPAGSTEKIKWYSIEEAYALNAKAPRKIFIDVYTNWCGYCKKMDAITFSDPRIVKYMNEHYYNVKLNAESSKEIVLAGQKYVNPNPDGPRSTHQLAAILLGGQMSYPSYVFLSEKTEKLRIFKGFMQSDSFEPIMHYYGSGAYLNQELEAYQQTFVKPAE